MASPIRDPCRTRAPSMANEPPKRGATAAGERTPQVYNNSHALAATERAPAATANQPSGTYKYTVGRSGTTAFSIPVPPQGRARFHSPQLRRDARRGAHAHGAGDVSTVAMQGGAEEAAGRCAAAAVARGSGCGAGCCCCREAQAGAPSPEGGFQGGGGAMQARDEGHRHSMQEVLVHAAPPPPLLTPTLPPIAQPLLVHMDPGERRRRDCCDAGIDVDGDIRLY